MQTLKYFSTNFIEKRKNLYQNPLRIADFIDWFHKVLASFVSSITEEKTTLIVYHYVVNLMFNKKYKYIMSFLQLSKLISYLYRRRWYSEVYWPFSEL